MRVARTLVIGSMAAVMAAAPATGVAMAPRASSAPPPIRPMSPAQIASFAGGDATPDCGAAVAHLQFEQAQLSARSRAVGAVETRTRPAIGSRGDLDVTSIRRVQTELSTITATLQKSCSSSAPRTRPSGTSL